MCPLSLAQKNIGRIGAPMDRLIKERKFWGEQVLGISLERELMTKSSLRWSRPLGETDIMKGMMNILPPLVLGSFLPRPPCLMTFHQK